MQICGSSSIVNTWHDIHILLFAFSHLGIVLPSIIYPYVLLLPNTMPYGEYSIILYGGWIGTGRERLRLQHRYFLFSNSFDSYLAEESIKVELCIPRGSCIYVSTQRYRHAGMHVYISCFFSLQKFPAVPHCIDYHTTTTHTSICEPICPAVLFIATGANPVPFPALGFPAVLVLIALWQFSLSAMALMILSTGLLCRRLSHSLGFGTFLHQ